MDPRRTLGRRRACAYLEVTPSGATARPPSGQRGPNESTTPSYPRSHQAGPSNNRDHRSGGPLSRSGTSGGPGHRGRIPSGHAHQAPHPGRKCGNFDARKDGPARKVLAARGAQLAANPSTGVRNLRKQLGMQGIVDVDPLTGTPRRLSRLDGFLTGPSTRKPEAIALDYVRAHADVFGLSAAEVAGLQLRKDYVDIAGTHHLSFVQSVGGVTVFGNGLKAHVAKNGRLIQVDGSPVAALPASLGTPGFSAARARDSAVEDVFGSSKASVVRTGTGRHPQDRVQQRRPDASWWCFQTLGGMRLAWQTILMREGYLVVQDAQDGQTLFRQNLVAHDSGKAWDNYPQAPHGRHPAARVNFTSPGWLPNNSPHLAGNVAHVFKDVNDDDVANAGEEVPPSGDQAVLLPVHPVHAAPPVCPTSCARGTRTCRSPGRPTPTRTRCSCSTSSASSTTTSQEPDRLHPCGRQLRGGRRRRRSGQRDRRCQHRPARAARRQPRRQREHAALRPTASRRGCRCTCSTSRAPLPRRGPVHRRQLRRRGGHRLPRVHPRPVQPPGRRRQRHLDARQHPGRLDGRGLERLVRHGLPGRARALERDTATEGELRVGKYVGWGRTSSGPSRSTARVGSTATACAGTARLAGPGGYTYGDFGRIIGGPEVHADGEIWVQTLWDLRKALGIKLTRVAGDPGDGAVPGEPVLPGHAQLDPRRRTWSSTVARSRTKIWQVFAAPRHGLVRRLASTATTPRRSRTSRCRRRPNTPTRLADRHGDATGHRRAGRRRDRRLRWPQLRLRR